MAETKYTKTAAQFIGLTYPTPDLTALESEIYSSAIVTAFSRIRHISGGDYDIYFKDALSAEDETNLTALIEAHTGEPLPHEPTRDSEDALVVRLKKASWVRNYCKRVITFTTSKLNSIDDPDIDGTPNAATSIKFYDSNGDELVDPDQATLDSSCVETHIEIDYSPAIIEIDTAILNVPATLAGGDDPAWKYYAMIAATTAKIGMTGLIPLRHYKDGNVAIGQSVEIMKIEPDTLGGQPFPDGHILHFCIKHPAGAQSEFFLEGVCYK